LRSQHPFSGEFVSKIFIFVFLIKNPPQSHARPTCEYQKLGFPARTSEDPVLSVPSVPQCFSDPAPASPGEELPMPHAERGEKIMKNWQSCPDRDTIG